MRTLNEQWIENGRMYKAVVQKSKIVNRIIDGNICHGCCHVDKWDDDCLHFDQMCPVEKGLIVKDLGPVNEDGCLAEERTGLFPKIRRLEIDDCVWVAAVHDEFVTVMAYGNTKQEAINAWNRRAR